MNNAHLHLVLVHIPIVLVPTAVAILLISLLRKQSAGTTIGLSLCVAAALCALPAFLVGEDAEELVEDLPGISKHAIEEHEEAADISFWLSLTTGGLALLALATASRAPKLHQNTCNALILLGSITSITLAYTGYEGGKIRHPEAYDGTSSPSSAHRGEHDDDD